MIIGSRNYDGTPGTNSNLPLPSTDSAATNRLSGRSASGGHSHGTDDISALSFGDDSGPKWMSNILGEPYVAQNDGNGKFTPAPRTPIPQHDHDGRHPHHGEPGEKTSRQKHGH